MSTVVSSSESKIKTPKWGELIDSNDPSKGKFYKFHAKQEEAYLSEARFTAAVAGTGGGKTVLGPLWAAKQIYKVQSLPIKERRPFLGMVVAPTYKVLSRATVPELIKTFKGTKLEGTYLEQKNLYIIPDKYYVNSAGERETIYGGKIWCQGADNPGSLEGGQFDFVWADEGGQLKLMVWIAIQGRTGQKQAPILITTTPYTKNWLVTDFYDKFLKGDKNYKVVQWSSKDNPAYPKEEYERAKGAMSSAKGEMRYDGKLTFNEGLVYENFSNCCVVFSKQQYNELLNSPGRFYGGIDYGWNDPFCSLVGLLDPNDVLWIFWERYISKRTIEEHINNLFKPFGRSVSYFSDHSPENISKIRKAGFHVRSANKAITPGIDAVNARINTGRLKIVVNCCPALVSEGETYSFPEDEETTGGENPNKECNDHAMDALRYMIMGIDVKRSV